MIQYKQDAKYGKLDLNGLMSFHNIRCIQKMYFSIKH